MLINEIVQVDELFGKKKDEATHIDVVGYSKPVDYNGQKYIYDKDIQRWKEKVKGTIIAPGSTVDKVLLKTAGFDKQGYAKFGSNSLKSRAGHWLGQDTTDGSIGQRTGAAAGAVVGGVVGGAGKLVKKGYNALSRGLNPGGPVAKSDSGFKIGDIVQWEAAAKNKNIQKGDIVSSQILGFEGDKYEYPKGKTNVVAPGKALFKTARAGLPFQKSISLLTKVK